VAEQNSERRVTLIVGPLKCCGDVEKAILFGYWISD
jgi:hypothetical protein